MLVRAGMICLPHVAPCLDTPVMSLKTTCLQFREEPPPFLGDIRIPPDTGEGSVAYSKRIPINTWVLSGSDDQAG